MAHTENRILIVADNLLARAGLAALLSDRTDCKIVGQTDGGDSLLSEFDVYLPDAVVYDLGWTPAPAITRLTDLGDSGIPVVALLPDEEYAAETIAALSPGDSMAESFGYGLLLREAEPDALAAAIQAVMGGLVVFDPLLAVSVLPEAETTLEAPAEDLTPRENEVLQLLAEGLANKAIALRLGISDHTVKFHVNAILGKLDAQSRTEAVVRATRLGLIIL